MAGYNRRMVTSRDVARAAGVSQATVSRVLSDGVVSESARRRVLAAMRDVGYVPNRAARAMRTGRSGTVGVVVADLENPFYPLMLDALSAAVERAGLRMIVWVATNSTNAAALEAIRERSVDGVVFTTATEHSAELHSALERGSPVVLVNRALPEVACDQVSSDNDAGGALVADYLVRHDRIRAAFIGGPPRASTSRARLRGFERRLRELGHPLRPDLVVEGEYTYDDGRRGLERMLRAAVVPNALFCGNDLLALGAMDAARAAGIRVPDDLWIVGYDDIPMSAWNAYDLTTVRQDVTETAGLAVSLLVSRVAGDDRPPVRTQFAPQLIVRGSTRHSV